VDEEPEEPMTVEEMALNHPGGPRCFYDALAFGCPTSITSDGKRLLCSCDYFDNSWLSVLSKFIEAFRTDESQRTTLATRFNAIPEAEGIISLDVGLPLRLQCGAPLAGIYPGSNFEIDVDEIYRLLGSFIYPEVRQKLTELCLPGRIALQLICQHVFIHGMKDYAAAKSYVAKMTELLVMVGSCVDDQTPWPFPGLKKFLRPWQKVLEKEEFPDASKMAWYPDPRKMRAKTSEESSSNYFPCVPLKDPGCFPSGERSEYTSCETCCDPAAGPQGNANCWGGGFTFARCCNTPDGGDRYY